VIRVKEDDAKMEVSLDTSQYRPDELNVSVSGGVVTIEGKHERKERLPRLPSQTQNKTQKTTVHLRTVPKKQQKT